MNTTIATLLLAGVEIPAAWSLTGLLLTAATIGTGILLLRRMMANKQANLQKSERSSSSLERKYEEVNVWSQVGRNRGIGGIAALFTCFLLINITHYTRALEVFGEPVEMPEDITLEPPLTPPTPPPPALPPPPPPPTDQRRVVDSVLIEEPVKIEPEPDDTQLYDPNNKGLSDPNSKAVSTPPVVVEPPKRVDDVSEVFTVVEQMPRFPGCEGMDISDEEKKKCSEQRMLEWVYSQIKYPSQARDLSVEGTTVISFVVDEKGNISDIAIRKKVGGGCEEEAERVVKKMAALPEKWTPGMQRGKPVKVRYNLPIRFKLK
jgi:protein TonB